jgi:hypothetical protein
VAVILRNATTPRTVTFVDQTNGAYRQVVSRCAPVFLTMLEKTRPVLSDPTVDPAAANVGLVSCRYRTDYSRLAATKQHCQWPHP